MLKKKKNRKINQYPGVNVNIVPWNLRHRKSTPYKSNSWLYLGFFGEIKYMCKETKLTCKCFMHHGPV